MYLRITGRVPGVAQLVYLMVCWIGFVLQIRLQDPHIDLEPRDCF